ncbi:MAG: hypothetical protein R3247_10020 [Rhodothermales bacterium]|nr:hypothetical protein [Rhodothermales bacterium]
MPVYRRAAYVLVGTFVAYGVLVGTHLGEFWPFSIYPMFSQGGNPWSRAVVRDVTGLEEPLSWQAVGPEGLMGRPFATKPNGIDPIDLANFVSKTERWDADRAAGLRRMFYDQLEGRRLLVLRANGRLEADSVAVEFVPYALLDAEGITLNPALPR